MALDNITLTATPASAANSAESGGLRIDGYDSLTQPIARIFPTIGDIRFTYRPRHADPIVASLGNATPYVCRLMGVANYIDLYWSAASTLTLAYNDGVVRFTNWATGGAIFTPDTSYAMRITYSGAGMRLYIDGILRITVAIAPNFTGDLPVIAYWGSDDAGAQQNDIVLIAP